MKHVTRKTLLAGIKFAAVALFFNTFCLKAQNQNSLAFNGNNNLATTPAASALISGSNAMSVSCWVYPANPTPQSTSYDGICGFRNNTDADFYLLHYSAGIIEARFRNSAGVAFDIAGTGIVVNTWQHLTLTYDGSWLKYYRNAICTDSVAASGNITANAADFYIGGLPYQNAYFYLIGKVDEVTLWDKALSNEELTCVYNGNADTSDVNLLLYYKFNQGAAGGNNTAINSLTDEMGNINSSLSNFSMTGSASNFVAGATGAATAVSAGICHGDTFYFGNQALTVSGIYYNQFTSTQGCDSTVELSLTASTVNATATQNGTTLVASPSFAVYQWFNCATNTAFIGATNVSYNTQGLNGNYGVVVTQNNCSDTSNCVAITTGIENTEFANSVHAYPNPLNNFLNVDLNKNYVTITVSVTDIAGKELLRSTFENIDIIKTDVTVLSKGIYFVHLTADDKTAVLKLIKN